MSTSSEVTHIEDNRISWTDGERALTVVMEPDGSVRIHHQCNHHVDQTTAESILADLGAPQKILDFIGADLEAEGDEY